MTATHDGVAPELIDAMVRLRPGGMTWRRTFPGRPAQVPEARRFVRFLLADSSFQRDAEQIVAELAANAVRHTASGWPCGTFVVEVVRRPEATRVTVYDSGRGSVPAIVHPALLGEGGRGLPWSPPWPPRSAAEAPSPTATPSGPSSAPEKPRPPPNAHGVDGHDGQRPSAQRSPSTGPIPLVAASARSRWASVTGEAGEGSASTPSRCARARSSARASRASSDRPRARISTAVALTERPVRPALRIMRRCRSSSIRRRSFLMP